jgi:hypothetical protein
VVVERTVTAAAAATIIGVGACDSGAPSGPYMMVMVMMMMMMMNGQR